MKSLETYGGEFRTHEADGETVWSLKTKCGVEVIARGPRDVVFNRFRAELFRLGYTGVCNTLPEPQS